MNLDCCACGCDLSTRLPMLAKAVDYELDRREQAEADGVDWPVIGIVCKPCEVIIMKDFED